MKRLKLINIGPGVKKFKGPKTDVNDVLGMSSPEVTGIIHALSIAASLDFSVFRQPSQCIMTIEDLMIHDWRTRRALIVFFLANIGLAGQEEAEDEKPSSAAVN